MHRVLAVVAALVALAFLSWPSQALAQSSTNYSAANQWGTFASGVAVTGSVDSAVAHTQNGIAAGQVNAAELGALFGTGGSSTINAIGSQTIISTSIIGNGDTSTVNATQTSSNTGAVKNGGQIGQTNSGNSNN